MTRSRFNGLTAEQFADWVFENYYTDEVRGFFYGMRDPEGYHYATSRGWLIGTCWPGLVRYVCNWPTALLDTDELSTQPN